MIIIKYKPSDLGLMDFPGQLLCPLLLVIICKLSLFFGCLSEKMLYCPHFYMKSALFILGFQKHFNLGCISCDEQPKKSNFHPCCLIDPRVTSGYPCQELYEDTIATRDSPVHLPETRAMLMLREYIQQ